MTSEEELVLLQLYRVAIDGSPWEAVLEALAILVAADAVRLTDGLRTFEHPRQGQERGDAYQRPFEIDLLGVGEQAKIQFGRPRTRPDFTQAERETIKGFAPHLERALRLRRPHRGEAPELPLAQAIDRFAVPCIGLEPNGRIVLANAAGAEALREGVLLAERDGRLVAIGAQPEARLANALCGLGKPGLIGAHEITLASHADVQGAASLVLVPHWIGGRPFVMAYLMAGRSVEFRPAGVARLRSLFDLTEAETAVAVDLMQGASAHDIAAGRAVSIGTVRSQIKTLLRKVGGRRQADLYRLRALAQF